MNPSLLTAVNPSYNSRNKSGRYHQQRQHINTGYYPFPYFYYYSPHPSIHYTSYNQDIVKTNNTRDIEGLHEPYNISSDQYKSIDLKKQLEYYFSRQNLVNDTFLVSHMDSQMYVPISLIASFKRVREWTSDINLVVKTLRESSAVIVDESGTKVKPNISQERNTIILRDMPECTEEEVIELLKSLNSPPIQSIKKEDIGSMWYISLTTEKDALKLLNVIQGTPFKEKPIAARMKSEPALRLHQRTAVAPSSSFTTDNINRVIENQKQQKYRYRHYKRNPGDGKPSYQNKKKITTNQVEGRSPRAEHKQNYYKKPNNAVKPELEQINTELSNMVINEIPLSTSSSSTYTTTSSNHEDTTVTEDPSPVTPDDMQLLPQQPQNHRNHGGYKHNGLNSKSHNKSNPSSSYQHRLRNQDKKYNNNHHNQRNGHINKKAEHKSASRDARREKYVKDNLKPSQFPPLPITHPKIKLVITPDIPAMATDIVQLSPKIPQLQKEDLPKPSSYADILKKKE